jgi:hypothetical protein
MEPSLDLADWNDATDHGVHIVEPPNMMAWLVNTTKHIEPGKMHVNNKGLNVVPRQTYSPRLDNKL